MSIESGEKEREIIRNTENTQRDLLVFLADSLCPLLKIAVPMGSASKITTQIIWQAFGAVSYWHTQRKIEAFIAEFRLVGEISSLSIKMQQWFSQKENAQRILEHLLISLDRYYDESKARLLSKIFYAFVHGKINEEEWEIFRYAIEVIHPVTGIDTLKEFWESYLRWPYSEDTPIDYTDTKRQELERLRANIDFVPLTNSGLLILPSGGAYAGAPIGAFLNESGIKFCEIIF